MRKRTLLIVAGLLVLLLGAAGALDLWLKGKEHPGLRVFLGQVWRNYPRSFAVDPPVLRITVDDDAMERIQAVVDAARERGVIMPEGNDYVQGEVVSPEGEWRARLRIKGKMSDHVEGDKWSFRVIARKDGGFLGMKRFSLQHPGTRNYLAEWFYHRLMRGEGLVALRYGFCRVELNGEDLGVYAYEEHFGPELLEHNDRIEGPLVRFDPGLFWQHRLNGVEGLGFEDGYGDQQAAALDGFGTNDLKEDPKANAVFEEAMTLMEAFRTGRRPASAVFEVERTGRRLALLDLLGGHRSMDWSDVKFHYDPVAQRFGPVSYESVSGFPIREIAGAFRCTGPATSADEFHTALFRDTVIFAAYVRALERYARPEWLDSAFTALKGPLDTASATLYGEFPYKELDREVYRRNQRIIQRALALPKAFHAHPDGRAGDTLFFTVVPVNNLPVLVDSLRLVDGRTWPVLGDRLVFARSAGQPGVPQRMAFLGTQVTDSLLMVDATIAAHVPGASAALTAAVFHQRLDPYDPAHFPTDRPANVGEFPFLHVDPATRTITTAPGRWVIDHDMVLPAGHVWKARAPLELQLAPGVRIISRAALFWEGREDLPIAVNGSGGSAILVLGAHEPSRIGHVRFAGLGAKGRAGLTFHQAALSMELSSVVAEAGACLVVNGTEATVQACSFTGGSDQLRGRGSKLLVSGSRFEGAGDDALTIEGGSLQLNNGWVAGAAGIGVKALLGARVEMDASAIEAAGTGVEAGQAAYLRMTGGALQAPRSVHAGKAELRYGPVRVELQKVRGVDAATVKCGRGSSVSIDGRSVNGPQPPLE